MLNEDEPPGDIARRDYGARVRRIFWMHAAPLVLGAVIGAYLFLPISVRIQERSHVSLWDFNFQRTAFLLIHISLVLIGAYCLYLSLRLLSKLR
jgi:hypothetical protein